MPDIIHYVTAKRGGPTTVESSAVLPPSAEYAAGNVTELTNVRSFHGQQANSELTNRNLICTVPYFNSILPHTQIPDYNIPSTSQTVNQINNAGSRTLVYEFGDGGLTSRGHIDEALAYIEEVRNAYILQPQVYEQFLETMREFKAATIDIKTTLARISNLFRYHKELITKFRIFLPIGYSINLNINEEQNNFHVVVRNSNFLVNDINFSPNDFTLFIESPSL